MTQGIKDALGIASLFELLCWGERPALHWQNNPGLGKGPAMSQKEGGCWGKAPRRFQVPFFVALASKGQHYSPGYLKHFYIKMSGLSKGPASLTCDTSSSPPPPIPTFKWGRRAAWLWLTLGSYRRRKACWLPLP